LIRLSQEVYYENRWFELEQTTNPFGIVVMAHLKAKQTKKNPQARYNWKLTLFRNLYERGFTRKDIIELYRFLDWIMSLPKELEISFKTEVKNQEESRRMKYVTNIERFAMEETKIDNTREKTIKILDKRFNNIPESLREKIRAIDDLPILERLFDQAILIESVPAFQQFFDQILAEKSN